MSDAAPPDVPAAIVVADARTGAVAEARPDAPHASIEDDTLAPDWTHRPAPRSRPGTGRMRDDLIAPEGRLRRARPAILPLGDELIEPNWMSLRPAGFAARRHLRRLGDDPLPPDWGRLVPRDGQVRRTGPIGDDLLGPEWAALAPRRPVLVLDYAYQPIGDDVLRPQWPPSAFEASRGRRDASGALERSSGRALERPDADSIDEHRDTLPID